MGVLFISHSSRDNEQAREVRDWLRDNGWGESFLDLDPEHGIAPGQRWLEELKKAGERCSAVVVLISPAWLESIHCRVEAQLAAQLGKPVFGVIVAPTPLDKLPPELTAHYQLADISTAAKRADGFERLGFGLERAGLDPKDFPWPPPDEPHRPAYRGLRALEEKDAGIFFGRDAAITRGLDALRRLRDGAPERMLVVLGASGAGKSSFLKAGLLARLARDEKNFLVLPTLRPERAAMTGPQGLLEALGLAAVPPASELAAHLAALRNPVVDRLSRRAAAAREKYEGRPPTLILPIDQAEELFAAENPESVAALELLRACLAVDGDLVLVLTLRSESYSKLQNEPRLAEISRLPFDLPRLNAAAFKEVIEAPGRLARPAIEVEPALIERLLAGLDGPDSLPLLAFTLERLVAEYGAVGRLELSQLEEGLGGIAGAIEKAVEAALAAARRDPGLPTDRASLEALARRAFLPWLVGVDDADAPPKRRVAGISELPAETQTFVGHLVDQRLLVSDERDGERVVEVSHEAVLRHWRSLAAWIEEEREALRTLAAVQAAARDWERRPADPGEEEAWLVHRGPRLAGAESLLGRPDYRQLLGEVGREYLAACRRVEDRQRAEEEEGQQREKDHLERRQRLQRRVAFAQVLAALVVAFYGWRTLQQARETGRQESRILVDYARKAIAAGNPERAMRLAALAAQEVALDTADPAARPALAAAAHLASRVMEFRGHEATIAGASLSPDGSRLLSWSEDGSARVWDVASGAELAGSRHPSPVAGAVFDEAGNRVLSWSVEGVQKIWNAATGVETAVGRPVMVNLAMFQPGGQRVLSCGKERGAFIWDAATGAEIAAMDHPRGCLGALFDPAGRRVFSWDDDRARVWDAATGLLVSSMAEAEGLKGAAFDRAGARVLVWDAYRHLQILDAASGRRLADWYHPDETPWEEGDESEPPGVRGAAFDVSGTKVLSWTGDPDWGGDDRARVWDAATGVELASAKHRGGAMGAVFDAAGGRVQSWDSGGVVKIWNAATGAEVADITVDDGILGAVFDAKGQNALFWNPAGSVHIFDLDRRSQRTLPISDGPVAGAFFDARTDRIFSWGQDLLVEAALPSYPFLATGSSPFLEMTAKVDARGERVLSWPAGPRTREGAGIARPFQLWNAATGERVAASTDRDGDIDGAGFDATGNRALTWGQDGKVRIWNAAIGLPMAVLDHPDVAEANFSADGKRVLSIGLGIARVWDVASGAQLATLEIRPVGGAAFDVAGDRVVTWGYARDFKPLDMSRPDMKKETFQGPEEAGLVQVWDVATGKVTGVKSVLGQALGASFDPSGDRVLAWGSRGALVWEPATGAELAQIARKGLNGASFSPTGDRVLSWSESGEVLISSATSGVVLASADHRDHVTDAMFDAAGARVLSRDWNGSLALWSAKDGSAIASWNEAGEATFDASGRRVLTWERSTGSLRVWDAATGAELVALNHGKGVDGAVFVSNGERVFSWSDDGVVRFWDVSWSIPRASSRELIDEVCVRKLAVSPAKDGSDHRKNVSVRRISQADAQFAPILRDRVGEDVCAPPPWWKDPGWRVLRIFGTAR